MSLGIVKCKTNAMIRGKWIGDTEFRLKTDELIHTMEKDDTAT